MFDFAGMATAFSSMNGGPYWAATINHAGTPITDDGGSIITPGTASTQPCTVQVDVVTQSMRLDDDFQERDVRLIILGVDALTIEPSVTITDPMSPFYGNTYELKTTGRDPAALGWECRARGR